MDILQETAADLNKKTFLSHVFSTTEEGKAELLNVTQYSLMGVIPVVILNKLIQRFIPEADNEKSSLELFVEIVLQLIAMFCGIILIHRIITYFPTYSGFKYENLILTNVILAFLIIVLSIQTKLGLKVNILVDRVNELWSGSDSEEKQYVKKNVRVSQPVSQHVPSQADFLDNTSVQQNIFPPAPTVTSRNSTGYDNMMNHGLSSPMGNYEQPLLSANSVLGGSFGSSF